MKFDKNELYEIEKILDVYSAQINETINRYCQTSIHWEAIHKDSISPLADKIIELDKSYKFIKSLREKLQANNR